MPDITNPVVGGAKASLVKFIITGILAISPIVMMTGAGYASETNKGDPMRGVLGGLYTDPSEFVGEGFSDQVYTCQTSSLGQTTFPVKNVTRVNRTPHGNSVIKNPSDPGHGTYARADGIGEAVDLGVNTGSPVFAPFAGTAYIKSDGHNHDLVMIVKNGDGDSLLRIKSGETFAVLAHVRASSTLKSGMPVYVGQQVATTAISHLHFELILDGKPVQGSTVAEIWVNMKKALCIIPSS